RGLDVLVCTTDKDCRQLIGDRVRLFNLRKHEIFDRSSLETDWGITPEQVVDLQTLVGDSVDNVPGIAGIGIKTAAKFLRHVGTFDKVVEQARMLTGSQSGAKKASSLTPRLAANIMAGLEQARVSRALVQLALDVPIKCDWDQWRIADWDEATLLALFREWGF